MSHEQLRANDFAQFKCASSWLTALPLKSESYNLSKREFFDALALRYRWGLRTLLTDCGRGKKFTVDHGLSCCKGEYIHRRHDEVRDLFAKLLSEMVHDVSIEPNLTPLTGKIIPSDSNKSDEARLANAAREFWDREQKAFFDVGIFHPFPQKHLNQSLNTAFNHNESEKKGNIMNVWSKLNVDRLHQ